MEIPQGLNTSSGTHIGADSKQRISDKRRQSYLKHWKRVWFVRSLIFLLLLVALAIGALLSFEHTFATRIYPQITVHGVRVGQMTPAEANSALIEHFAPFLQQPVTLTYGEHTWQPTLAELGIQVDIAGAVQQAMQTGRRATREDTLRTVTAIEMYGWDIPLRVTVDQARMQEYLLARLSEIEESPVDAHLLLDGVRYEVAPEAYGRQVLVDATLLDITAAVQGLSPQVVPVRTRPLKALLSDASVAEARQQVAALLQGPLVLTAGDRTWEWSPEDIVRMIHIDRVPHPEDASDHLVVSLNEKLIRQHINWFAYITEDRGIYPRVDWNGGSPVIFRQGAPGSRIDEERAVAKVVEALWSSERSVELPFTEMPVPTTSEDLAQLGINELLAVGRSSFEDSEAYRVTNILAGMRLLHGILLAPGDEFSFNEAIGSIGAENGFVQGYAIVNERTQLEWGGGICQDSTTMFRAAFWAGLPITERWNHSHYISWYDRFGYGDYGNGPGIDATIFLGGPDLRFVNDTDGWILIQTYADPASEVAEVRLYGTKGGRSVEFGGRSISYRANGTMDVAFTRIIKQDGVETARRTYWSTFTPW